ncbi:MAG: hypothetical protein ACYC7D_10420 [Nitrososphaerales archaeon]
MDSQYTKVKSQFRMSSRKLSNGEEKGKVTDLIPDEKPKKPARHTKDWYIENYGVDPSKLNIEYIKVDNPHYRSAAPMKLYNEENVLPYKSQEKIDKHRELSERQKKVWEETKKKEEEAHAYIAEMKALVPLTEEERKRIDELDSEAERDSDEIIKLHFEKIPYYDTKKADYITDKQDRFRAKRAKADEERAKIFGEAKKRYIATLNEEGRAKLDEAYDRISKYYNRHHR